MNHVFFKTGFKVFAMVLTGAVLCACGLQTDGSDRTIFHNSERNKDLGIPLSTAVEADGWIFLSGTLGINPETRTLAPGGITPETQQIMENIKSNLSDLDLSMGDIVKCTVMIDDMADWPAFNAVYKTFFDGRYPARSAFGADGLALGAVVEVECIARR